MPFGRAEQWANRAAVPAHYPALLLLPGTATLPDGPASASLMSDGLDTPRSGAGIWLILQVPIWLIKHKHLLGLCLTCGRCGRAETGASEEGERRSGQPLWFCMKCCVVGAAVARKGQEKGMKLAQHFVGKPEVESADALPPLPRFLQLFLFLTSWLLFSNAF